MIVLHDPQGSLVEQGSLQRQGDLTIIEGRFTSSRRRVFLFENIIIIAKKNKASKGSTDTFAYKESYKVHTHTHTRTHKFLSTLSMDVVGTDQ